MKIFKLLLYTLIVLIIMISLSNLVYFIHNTYLLIIYIPIIYFLYKKDTSNKLNKIFLNKDKIDDKIKNERVFTEKERTFDINSYYNKKENIHMKILKLNMPISELSLNQLKKAYRRESKLFHPDNGGNIEKMKEINSAYTKLKELIKN